MAFDPITAALNLGNLLLDRLLPDKAANDAAKAQLLVMTMNGELQTAVAQLEVDKAEAASTSLFVAGWRPFVGWVCGAAFAYAFLFQPLILMIAVLRHSNFDKNLLPSLDLSTMMPVLLGMLGLGAMRSWDKVSGNGNGH